MVDRAEWLKQLPSSVATLTTRWSLSIGPVFDHSDVSCAWVAQATRRDGTPVVLKLSLPHMEAEHEIDGLRFWAGDPFVYLLDADHKLSAMLLERCTPGTSLRSIPEPDQDVIVAGLLRRAWRMPPDPHPFRPLSTMIAYWSDETRAASDDWSDATLVEEGLRAFEELSAATGDDVLLATDLHAGNVLSAQREPWLAIDPKPFVGDRTYDATQHLFNCRSRVQADPDNTIRRFADLLDLDYQRLRRWMFARAAAEPRDSWHTESLAFARLLSRRM